MNPKGHITSRWDALLQDGNELALWIAARYRGEKWLKNLAQGWGCAPRMIHHLLHGTELPSAWVLYRISQTTNISLDHIMDQHMIQRLKRRKR